MNNQKVGRFNLKQNSRGDIDVYHCNCILGCFDVENRTYQTVDNDIWVSIEEMIEVLSALKEIR